MGPKIILWLVVAIHFMQGTIILFDSSAVDVTSIYSLDRYLTYSVFTGIVLVLVSIFSTVGLLRISKLFSINWCNECPIYQATLKMNGDDSLGKEKLNLTYYEIPPREILWMIPQQLILIISAVGAFEAIIRSSFADSVIRPRGFIVADQSVYILLAIFQFYALLKIYAPYFHLHVIVLARSELEKIWTHGSR